MTSALVALNMLNLGNASDRGLIMLLLVVAVIACYVGGWRLGPGPGYYGGFGVGTLLLIILALLLLGVL